MIGPRLNRTQEAWLRNYRNYLLSASYVFDTLDDDEAISIALLDIKAALKMLESADEMDGVPSFMIVDPAGVVGFIYA